MKREMLVDSENPPDFVQGALEVLEHVLVALLKHVPLVIRDAVQRRPSLFLLHGQTRGV